MLSSPLQSLLQKRLWIVTGKGGVGKTTFSAALGLWCAEMGLNTLLIETHGLNHLGKLLGASKVGYEPHRVKKNLSLMQITPEAALEEYIVQQVHFRFIYNTVFNNNYVRHFLDAAPGLVELLTIGKIWYMADEINDRGRGTHYDKIIVDAPATGHGLSLLTVPHVVNQAVKVGPLKTKAGQILNFLQDAKKTAVWLVSLAEEMPINESIEMVGKLENIGMHLGPIALNSLWPKLAAPESLKSWEKSPNPLLQDYLARLKQSQTYVQKIEDKLHGHDFLHLPLVYQENEPLRIAEQLKANLAGFLAA